MIKQTGSVAIDQPGFTAREVAILVKLFWMRSNAAGEEYFHPDWFEVGTLYTAKGQRKFLFPSLFNGGG